MGGALECPRQADTVRRSRVKVGSAQQARLGGHHGQAPPLSSEPLPGCGPRRSGLHFRTASVPVRGASRLVGTGEAEGLASERES